jgi:hypothetical protein
VNEYHLQARRCLRGGGSRREQTRLLDVEALGEAERAAHELASDGYTVWIFRRTAGGTFTATTHRLRLVRTISPDVAEPDPAAPPAQVPADRPQRVTAPVSPAAPVSPSAAVRAWRGR